MPPQSGHFQTNEAEVNIAQMTEHVAGVAWLHQLSDFGVRILRMGHVLMRLQELLVVGLLLSTATIGAALRCPNTAYCPLPL